MTFHFAWVGGDPKPAVSLSTTGNLWGGSLVLTGSTWNGELTTSGDILGTGVWRDKGPSIQNLRRTDGLITGGSYYILGPGMAGATLNQSVPLTRFTFDGEFGGDLSPAADIGENVAVTITTFGVGSEIVYLDDASMLTVDMQYGISGPGIIPNTVFIYEGSNTITISNPATATNSNVEFTITLDTGRNVITNLGSAMGLVVGETYQIFGPGVTAGILGTLQSDGTILLSQIATETFFQTPLRIYRGITYDDGGSFDADIHTRIDESIVSIHISHLEGQFASLSADIKNPRIGLLAPGRQVWCWLSEDGNPLFHGRLEAMPANLIGEKVTFHFIAQPGDYDNQQNLITENLKELPFIDPIWFPDGLITPENVLEARTATWHIDRTTLAVSVSDYIVGEDGTLEIDASDHTYANTDIKFGSKPLTGIYLTAKISRTQEGSGSIDITREIYQAFRDTGSNVPYPHISAYCGDGLFSTWPKPGTNIGAGWSVGLDSVIDKTTIFPDLAAQTGFVSRFSSVFAPTNPNDISQPFGYTGATFPLDNFYIQFTLDYVAKREWVETLSFFLEADIQEISTDSRANTEVLSLASNNVSKAVDFDGSIPLADFRSNNYFKTGRGQLSVQFLIRYARAKITFRARAASIDFTIPWSKAIGLSCRQNVHLVDYRIPGGEATGKVISYELIASATEGRIAHVTIGCTIGRGGSVTATPGAGSYAAPGYMASGYQTVVGGTVDLGDSTVTYQNFGDFVINDDGVNLFDITPQTAIKRLKVISGVTEQAKAIAATKENLGAPVPTMNNGIPGSQVKPSIPPTTADALKNAYPLVELELISLVGGGFLSEFVIDVSRLQVPKTIDLEAPSNV